MTDYDVATERDKILNRWNPQPVDHGLDLVVGLNPPEGDTRATDHVPAEQVNAHMAAAQQSQYSDDASGPSEDLGSDEYGDDLDDMSKGDLQDEAEKRELSKSGSKAELRARIREHDQEADSGEDDDEEE